MITNFKYTKNKIFITLKFGITNFEKTKNKILTTQSGDFLCNSSVFYDLIKVVTKQFIVESKQFPNKD